MSSFFRQMVKDIGDVDTNIADDGLHSSEFTGTLDTGSYILNAALSGSIFGGVPNNKIIAFAGESATGKTFFVLGLMKQFLDDNKEGGVIYYDTEAAVTRDMMKERGLDTQRVIISEQSTVEGFRTHVSRTIDRYQEGGKDRPPMLLVLDSLGQLSTSKETGDINEGKETRDMTRAQLIRGTFRALSLKLAKANVALIITNHVSDQIGAYMPTKVMGGGCLGVGTKILLADGTPIEIQNVSVGDRVMTMSGFEEVLATFCFDDKELFEVEFEDGTKVKCSADHKFLVGEKYITVHELFSSEDEGCGINTEVTTVDGISRCSSKTNIQSGISP